MAPAWAGNNTVECLRLGVAVLPKQWGQYTNHPLVATLGYSIDAMREIDPPANGRCGAELGGRL